MNKVFREFLQKIGSGNHTGENLTFDEAYHATKIMLLGEATPAQIGAFLIAHRIKRPTGEEIAGMLSAYHFMGPKLQPLSSSTVSPIVLGIPYDGRTRTAPISPIIALLLSAAGQPVIMHGGDRFPTKYGLPLVDVWRGLGVDWTSLSLAKTQDVFEQTGIGFVYTPKHFPLTTTLWDYRDQIGKRPPLATMELIWCPYAGHAHIIAGFVHPPTEVLFQEAFKIGGVQQFTLIKGLEGSCELPRDRTAIIGLSSSTTPNSLERLLLAPRNYNFTPQNVPLTSLAELVGGLEAATVDNIVDNSDQLRQTALWNGGFYLWRSGICSDMQSGIVKAIELFSSGTVAAKLDRLRHII
jgi:anthranilate phosphoribosyltransferase